MNSGTIKSLLLLQGVESNPGPKSNLTIRGRFHKGFYALTPNFCALRPTFEKLFTGAKVRRKAQTMGAGRETFYEIDPRTYFQISGGGLSSSYQLAQVHFHWGSHNKFGSEHTINGVSYRSLQALHPSKLYKYRNRLIFRYLIPSMSELGRIICALN